MPSWTLSESQVICGRVEYFCKCSRQLTVQTAKTRKNMGKRFVTCSKCNVYDFLDDDLPSKYYKELLYGMFQKQKQSKKHMDYKQVINVLAMEKSMCEEELRATKSKLKLYDRYLLKIQVAKQMQDANACCSSLQQRKYLLQSKVNAANGKQPSNARCKCKIQMLACKCKMQDANASCKCMMQMQPAIASYKCKLVSNLQMQDSYAFLPMLACKCKLQMHDANTT
ncbi:hypothetical protein Tco_1300384 [Tanacetum coccineum]